MVSDVTTRQERRRVAAAARDQADALLRRLLQDRRQSEARFADAGKSDPLKELTGESAMDRAIASMREMIRRMDELLRELEADAAFVNGVHANGASNGSSNGRPGHVVQAPSTSAAS
jgi:hypothetical protein